jgi:CHASE2 domain-containing sensor protein
METADLTQFSNRIVLIGFTAEGLGDSWFTPFAESGKNERVEIHANAIDTLYAGRAIAETAAASLAWAGVIRHSAVVADRRFEGRRFYVAAIVTGPLVLAVSWALMKYANLWWPFPPFWAALVVVCRDWRLLSSFASIGTWIGRLTGCPRAGWTH